MSPLELAGTNLASPPVLAFALGAASVLFRSDLRLPDAVHVGLTTYLLLAIGLKGGAELSAVSPSTVFLPAVAAVLVGLAIPCWSFLIARRAGGLSVEDAASLAAHYGSVSVVTFTAAITFLDAAGDPAEGFLPALVAIMEVPGIAMAILLARFAGGGARTPMSESLRDVFGGRSIMLLGGGLAIGIASGKEGFERVAPFFQEPFYGVLVVFLLEMGIVAAARAHDVLRSGPFLVAFGTGLPLLHGALGVAAGSAAGLSVGGATALGTLAASASYIAAPAAVRIALPGANHGYALAAALAITFPFNLVVGIPLYHQFAKMIG
ncbi:MAG: sodium-dependent bicarbonate transport family permease [Dehalococcoidia bacterium]